MKTKNFDAPTTLLLMLLGPNAPESVENGVRGNLSHKHSRVCYNLFLQSYNRIHRHKYGGVESLRQLFR